MPTSSNNLDFSDMITWLKEDLKKEGYKILDTFEKDARLPIDLHCIKESGEGIKNLIILVASINKIEKEFQEKLLFFQYYISSYIDPLNYALVLAIPAKAEIDTEPFFAEEKEDKEKDFYTEYGFGVWLVYNKDRIDKAKYPAIPLRNKISEDLVKYLNKIDESLEKYSLKIVPFVDQNIHNSIKGMTAFNPPKFNERLIDYHLLEQSLKISKTSYCNCLCEGINEYLSKKPDSFKFCINLITNLWYNCIPEVLYPDVLSKLETLLKEMNPHYRDHYIHQFQVFLLGELIIDILYKNKKIEKNIDELCKGWMLASTFHDVNYPVQEHDKFMRDFFDQTLGHHQFGLLDFKNNYVDCKFSSSIELIIGYMHKCFEDSNGANTLTTEMMNLIREFFYYRVTLSKNHGILSALGLMKKLENQLDLHKIIIPASAACAFHDDDIWHPLKGIKVEKKDDDIKGLENLLKRSLLKQIDFKSHPLVFLLILCDNIQDWGRHYKDSEREKQIIEANFKLKDITYSSDYVKIQLYFTSTRKSRKFMYYKEQDFERIESLLKSPSIGFKIEYWDRIKDEKSDYEYLIH
jgi:hypothetical protein